LRYNLLPASYDSSPLERTDSINSSSTHARGEDQEKKETTPAHVGEISPKNGKGRRGKNTKKIEVYSP